MNRLSTGQAYNHNELLQQIAAGQEHAFKQLYNTHWNRLYTFALSWLKNNPQAEDIVLMRYVIV